MSRAGRGAEGPEGETASAGLERRVRSGAVWSAANSLGMKLGNIAILAVVARLVAPAEFGVFAAALTIAVILGSVADWGVSAFLVRADTDLDEVAPTVTFVAILSGSVLAGATMLSAPALAAVFAAPEAAAPIRVMAICLVLGGIAAVPTALLAREFRQDRIFWSNAVAFVPSNAVLLVLALDGHGAMAFAWSRVVAVACQGGFVLWSAHRWYRPALHRRTLRAVLAFGVPLAGANLVNYTLLSADYVVVGQHLGPAQLGAYVLAFNVASWATSILAAAINGVAMPAFSRVGAEPGPLAVALGRSGRAVALVAFPICTMTLVLADPLVRGVFGPRWGDSVPVLETLSLYGAGFVLVSLLSNLLVALGRTRRVLAMQVLWISALLPALLVGVRTTGVVGVAWAHVAVVLGVVLPVHVWAVGRHAERAWTTLGRAVLPPLLACGAVALAASGSSRLVDPPLLQLLVGGTAGGLVYLLAATPMLLDYVPAAGRARLDGRLGRLGGTRTATVPVRRGA